MAKTVANTEQIFKGKKLEVKLGTEMLKNMGELRNDKRDEKNETRTISVSGLPEESTENSVYIHFQKKKNDGGEIKEVELLEQGKAIVVFDDPQVAKTVANTEQIFKGKKLQVKLGTVTLKNREELRHEKVTKGEVCTPQKINKTFSVSFRNRLVRRRKKQKESLKQK